MATMRCARRHARGHRLQRCRQRVGLLVNLYSVAQLVKQRTGIPKGASSNPVFLLTLAVSENHEIFYIIGRPHLHG